MMTTFAAVEAAAGVAVAIGALHHANAHRPKEDSRTVAAIGMLIGVLALWLVANAFVTARPVVEQASATVLNSEPGRLRIQMVAFKALPCEHVATEAYVVDARGRQAEAAVTFEGDVSPGSSKPVGWIYFEPWSLTFPPEIAAQRYELEHWHRCGLVWLKTKSRSGPFDIRNG